MLKKLAGYAAYMFAATSFARLFSFAANMLGAKYRRVEDFGDYNTYVYLYGLMHVLLTSGAAQTIQKYAAIDDKHRRQFAVLVFRLFILLVILCGAIAIPVGFGWKWNMALAFVGAPWMIATTLSRFVIRTRLEAKLEARIFIVASLSTTSFQLVLLMGTNLPDALIYGDLAALIVAGAFALSVLPSAADIKWVDVFKMKVQTPFIKESLKFTAPIWAGAQVSQGGWYLRGAYTRGVLGTTAMGVIGLADYLWQFVLIPVDLLGQAALAGLVKETEDRPRLFRELLRLCLFTFPVIGIVVAGGIPLLLQIMKMDDKWSQVPPLLLLMILTIPFHCFQIVNNHYSVAEGRPRYGLYASIACTIPLALGIHPLGAALGLEGVIIAQGVTMTIYALAFVVPMWADYKADMRSGIIWTTLSTIAVGASAGLYYAYQDWAWRWTLTAPAVLIYVALLFLFGVAEKSHVTRLIRAVKERLGR
ncbi:MAG: hypothetical protein H6729_15200 [Deltaproteobacteria bacterium]|nr:hypothetical protein [Deltaproteobacteria bacterium]